MAKYIFWRLVGVLPVLLVVATVAFFILHLTPGDPARVMLGNEASGEAVAELRDRLGLDQPLPVQLLAWYIQIARLDLGNSLYAQEPVIRQIARHWEPTFLLTILATLLASIVGVPVGIWAATRHNTPLDQMLMIGSTLGISIASFWLGLNLIVLFAVILPWFPAQGFEPLSSGLLTSLRTLALPAFALGIPQIGLIARMSRSSMLEVLARDYVRTARAKGVAERGVIRRHALRNAIIPMVTVIGLSVAILMGGAVVIEQVFNIPGLGRLVVASIERRDYPVVQGTVLLVAAVYVLLNLLVDLVYALLDPRITYTE